MKRRPNIILLVLDTARKKSMSLYGYGRNTTPNLERFASECVVYDRAVSPSPWTVPSHASVFSGLYPSQHGLHTAKLSFWKRDYDLPSLLRAAGYNTAGLSANPLIGDTLGFSDSFDGYTRLWQVLQVDGRLGGREHNDIKDAAGTGRRTRRFPDAARHPAAFCRVVVNKLRDRAFGTVTEDATPSTVRGFGESLRAARRLSGGDAPYFMFVNVLQPHEKYNPPRAFRKRFAPEVSGYPGTNLEHYSGRRTLTAKDFAGLTRLYEAEVAFMDETFGTWIEGIRRLPDYDNTLIAVMSDHGEHLGEHGHLTHVFSLYQELVEVPLMVKYPRGDLGPGREGRLVQTHDLFATIVGAAGASMPRGSAGFSRPLTSPDRKTAVSQLMDTRLWVNTLKEFHPGFDEGAFPHAGSRFAFYRYMEGRLHKYMERDGGGAELYDLEADPDEARDISGEVGGGILGMFRRGAAAEMERLGYGSPGGGAGPAQADVEEETAAQLRSLGYM